MRVLLAPLAALILVAASAGAQGPDDAAAVARVSARAILAAQVVRVARLAHACGWRDDAWVSRVLRAVISQQERDAATLGDLVAGGQEGIRWMMLGARIIASSDAEDEHDRYGPEACRRLEASGHLTGVEGFLAARER